MLRLLLALGGSSLFLACASGERSMPTSTAPAAGGAAEDLAAPEGRAAARRAEPQQGDDRDAQPTPQPRMVHYNGYVKLKITTPEETLKQATALAEKAGGYLEAWSGMTVTLRIPVEKFRAAFTDVQKLGDVLARSMTAQDVTDQFVAMDLRLTTLKASRDRLITLLARANSEQEKLTLLREIRRLTEDIDRMETQLQTLAKLAAYSRLSVEVVPRQTHSTSAPDDVAAFRWIRNLSPFRRDVAQSADRFELPVPTGMVELDAKHLWSAEGPDGGVIWASQRNNEPLGDTDFWVAAIKFRLSAEYASTETLSMGRYSVVRLVDAGAAQYRYLIGVRADGDDLFVVEAHFATAEQEARYQDALRAVLEGNAT